MVESLQERNFVLKQEVSDLIHSGFFFDYRNYLTLFATGLIIQFPLFAFVLEWAKSKGMPSFVVSLVTSMPFALLS